MPTTSDHRHCSGRQANSSAYCREMEHIRMTITDIPVENGVNVEALLGARAAFTDNPEIAQFTWRSSVTWVNGTHSRSEVESFYGFSDEQVHHTSFSLDADHPLQFAAQDTGPT